METKKKTKDCCCNIDSDHIDVTPFDLIHFFVSPSFIVILWEGLLRFGHTETNNLCGLMSKHFSRHALASFRMLAHRNSLWAV